VELELKKLKKKKKSQCSVVILYCITILFYVVPGVMHQIKKLTEIDPQAPSPVKAPPSASLPQPASVSSSSTSISSSSTSAESIEKKLELDGASNIASASSTSEDHSSSQM
jgi:cytoskeletal protein RodZ